MRKVVQIRSTNRKPSVAMPAPGETTAVAVSKPKTAALYFDRVWSEDETAPSQIGFFVGTEMEEALYIKDIHDLPDMIIDQMTHEHSELPEHVSTPDYVAERLISRALRERSIFAPIMQSSEAYEQAFSAGNVTSILVSLSNIPLIVEKDLSWKQVLEFREDTANREKYRRMLRWLRSLNADSMQQARDQIEQAIDNYDSAMRKHGMKTRLGRLRFLLNFKQAAAIGIITAVGAELGSAVGGPHGGTIGAQIGTALASGLALGGQVWASITQEKLDLLEIETTAPGHQLAYIYGIHKEFGRAHS